MWADQAPVDAEGISDLHALQRHVAAQEYTPREAGCTCAHERAAGWDAQVPDPIDAARHVDNLSACESMLECRGIVGNAIARGAVMTDIDGSRSRCCEDQRQQQRESNDHPVSTYHTYHPFWYATVE